MFLLTEDVRKSVHDDDDDSSPITQCFPSNCKLFCYPFVFASGKYFRVVLFLCSNYMLNRLREKKQTCCFNWLAEEKRRLPAGPLSDNYNGL